MPHAMPRACPATGGPVAATRPATAMRRDHAAGPYRHGRIRTGAAVIGLALWLGASGGPGRAAPMPRAEVQPTTEIAGERDGPSRTAARKVPSLQVMRGQPPARSTCDDGDPCTHVDVCEGGACVGTQPLSCPPIDQCHSGGACRPETGACTTPPAPDGTPCDDGSFCTTADACRTGNCTADVRRDCNDGDRCTGDLCDEEMDSCTQSVISPCCGDGVREGHEMCDAGVANADTPNAACRTDCRLRRCGDGIADDAFGERCDDGRARPDAPRRLDPTDGPDGDCRMPCLPPRCGDGITDPAGHEQCDDGNIVPGDACSPRCAVEPPAAVATIDSGTDPYIECVIAWRVAGVTPAGAVQLRRVPPCRDGDSGCDRDGVVNGECRFDVWLCSNTTRPVHVPCSPGAGRNGVGTVALAEVRAPTARHAVREPTAAHNRAELELAAAAAAVGGNLDVCGPRLDVRVPLQRPGRKAATRLKVRATTNRNVRDGETLRLVCVPAGRAGRSRAAPQPETDARRRSNVP